MKQLKRGTVIRITEHDLLDIPTRYEGRKATILRRKRSEEVQHYYGTPKAYQVKFKDRKAPLVVFDDEFVVLKGE